MVPIGGCSRPAYLLTQGRLLVELPNCSRAGEPKGPRTQRPGSAAGGSACLGSLLPLQCPEPAGP
eukprot:2266076-Rhodomonas_salina.1